MSPQEEARKERLEEERQIVKSVNEGELSILSRSLTPIAVDPFNQASPFVTTHEMRYRVGRVEAEIEEMFRLDSVSIPELARNLVGCSQNDISIYGDAVHAKFYQDPRGDSRVVADALFLAVLQSLNYRPSWALQFVAIAYVALGAWLGWDAVLGITVFAGVVRLIGAPRILYYGVRLGGWWTWWRYRVADRNAAAARAEAEKTAEAEAEIPTPVPPPEAGPPPPPMKDILDMESRTAPPKMSDAHLPR